MGLFKNKNRQNGIGTVLLKPSEVNSKTVSEIEKSGASASVVTGTPTNITVTPIRTGGGGSGSGSSGGSGGGEIIISTGSIQNKLIEAGVTSKDNAKFVQPTRQEQIKRQALNNLGRGGAEAIRDINARAVERNMRIDEATRQAQERYNTSVKDFVEDRKKYYSNLVNEGKLYNKIAEKKYNEEVQGYSKDYLKANQEQLNRDVQGIIVKGDISTNKNIYFSSEKPPLVISAVPTYKELVKSEAKSTGSSILGLLGGTRQYIELEVTKQRYISANRGNLGTYQPEAQGRIAGLFFNMNPVSGVLYGLGSVEQLARKSGREALSNQQMINLQSGDTFLGATTKAYAPALFGAGLTVIGAVKGTRYLQEARATKTIQKELINLGQSPIEDLTIIERGVGGVQDKVTVQGFQRFENYERQIALTGKLKKLDSGLEFLPEGQGAYTTTGISKYKNIFGINKPYIFTETGTFSSSSTGASKLLGSAEFGRLGELQVSRDIGISINNPRASTYGIFQIPRTTREAVISGNQLAEQLKGNILRGGDKTVSIDESLIFSKGRNAYAISKTGKSIIIDKAPPEAQGYFTFSANSEFKRTPLEKTFGEQPLIIKEVVKKTSPIKIVSPETRIIQIQKPEGFNIPYMVGGLGLKEIPQYKTTNLFEEVSYLRVPQSSKEISLFTPKILINARETNLFELKTLTKAKEETIFSPISKSKSGVLDLTKVNEIEKIREVPRLTEKQKVIQKQVPRFQPPRITTRPEIKIPKVIIPVLPKTSLAKRLERKANAEPELFKVFGKRFGKDIELLSTTNKDIAESKLKSFLKGTLGRSGKIIKNNEPLSFKELKSFGGEFREAKKDPFRIVQKAKFSLGTKGETSEIQMFKSRKKKKSVFNFY